MPHFNLFEAACLSELHARQSGRRVPSRAPLLRQNHVRISKLGIPEICAPQLL